MREKILGTVGTVRTRSRKASNYAVFVVPTTKTVTENTGNKDERKAGMNDRHTSITNIQNRLWAIYKGLIDDHDMKACNHRLQALKEEYTQDAAMRSFVESLIMAWIPILNEIQAEWRNESK